MTIGLGGGISFPDKGTGGAAAAHITGITFDKAVASGSQYKITMSDGTEFTFVVPEGKGLDLSGLKDGSVPVYNAVSGELVDSGVLAGEGDITMAPNSLKFGTHVMSSTPENVIYENTSTGHYYAPIWQEVVAGVNKAYLRALSTARDITRNSHDERELTNPDFVVPVKKDETVFKATIKLSRPAKGIRVEVFSGGKFAGRIVKTGTIAAGEQTLTLTPPWDFRKGTDYTIKLRDPSGDILYVLGSSTLPFWKINRSVWTELPLATQKWVAAQIALLNTQFTGIANQFTALGTKTDNTQTQVVNLQNDVKGKLYTMDEIIQNLKGMGYLKPDVKPDPGTKASIRAYVFFQASPSTPTAIPPAAQAHSGTDFTVSKANDDPEYVFVLVPLADSKDVTRVAEKGGLPAVWAKTRVNFGGVEYDVLRSPSAFAERNPEFELYS